MTCDHLCSESWILSWTWSSLDWGGLTEQHMKKPYPTCDERIDTDKVFRIEHDQETLFTAAAESVRPMRPGPGAGGLCCGPLLCWCLSSLQAKSLMLHCSLTNEPSVLQNKYLVTVLQVMSPVCVLWVSVWLLLSTSELSPPHSFWTASLL